MCWSRIRVLGSVVHPSCAYTLGRLRPPNTPFVLMKGSQLLVAVALGLCTLLGWTVSYGVGEPDYIRWAIGNATSAERKASLVRIQNHVRAFEEAIGILPPGSAPQVPTHGRHLAELDCFDSCLDPLCTYTSVVTAGCNGTLRLTSLTSLMLNTSQISRTWTFASCK